MGQINIPNLLTSGRILLAPVLALAMQPHVDASIAALIFAVGMTTDFADGYIARTRRLVTKFGTLADPIADKLFVGTALVGLAATNRIAAWVVVVVFARELLVTGMRLAAQRQGVIIPANRLGKAKTVLQAFVVFVLLVASPGAVTTEVLVYLMVAVTVISGLVYVHGYMLGRKIGVRRVASASAVGARATAG
jgi:CDP-diacylglycerol--glycerol-3-phosphate 3-phosphatidyltransferase